MHHAAELLHNSLMCGTGQPVCLFPGHYSSPEPWRACLPAPLQVFGLLQKSKGGIEAAFDRAKAKKKA